MEQRVRAQIRPDQDLGKVRVRDLPELRVKPVVGSGGEVAPERRPGHTVCRHLFTSRNDAAWSSEERERVVKKKKRKTRSIGGRE